MRRIVLGLTACVAAVTLGPASASAPATLNTWMPLERHADGAPVGWRPCSTVTWAEFGNGPRGALRYAFRTMSAATGLRFVPARPGHRYAADLIIRWQPAARTEDLTKLGLLGYAVPRKEAAARFWSAADIRVNRDAALAGSPALRRALVLHELGHAVGLGHVTDSEQLMYPIVRDGRDGFGPGDLEGLREIQRPELCFAASAPKTLHRPSV